jgi:nicotinamidase-related amidase
MPDHDLDRSALLVVDVQQGLDDPVHGPRNNPDCEANVAALIAGWREAGRPVVVVRHDSADPDSTLRPGGEGNDLKEVVHGVPDLLVTKSVSSAFHGEPDLDAWLRARGLTGVVICGIQTNYCCESTARTAADLGYDMVFALDATHTFDLVTADGTVLTADDLARATAANLHGEFGTVVTTAELLGGRAGGRAW